MFYLLIFANIHSLELFLLHFKMLILTLVLILMHSCISKQVFASWHLTCWHLAYWHLTYWYLACWCYARADNSHVDTLNADPLHADTLHAHAFRAEIFVTAYVTLSRCCLTFTNHIIFKRKLQKSPFQA